MTTSRITFGSAGSARCTGGSYTGAGGGVAVSCGLEAMKRGPGLNYVIQKRRAGRIHDQSGQFPGGETKRLV